MKIWCFGYYAEGFVTPAIEAALLIEAAQFGWRVEVDDVAA